MNVLSKLHGRILGRYRLQALVRQVAEIVPENATVLDVGCGNGSLAAGVLALRPDIRMEGIDLETVPSSSIAIHYYDGKTIPFPDDSWDVCMANDVIHHCDNMQETLGEMCRVAKSTIILKDHIADSWFDFQVLRLMDWVGNRGYGTPLPYNFLTSEEWAELFQELHLQQRSCRYDLGLYPPVFLGLLDRRMHFLAALNVLDREVPQRGTGT